MAGTATEISGAEKRTGSEAGPDQSEEQWDYPGDSGLDAVVATQLQVAVYEEAEHRQIVKRTTSGAEIGLEPEPEPGLGPALSLERESEPRNKTGRRSDYYSSGGRGSVLLWPKQSQQQEQSLDRRAGQEEEDHRNPYQEYRDYQVGTIIYHYYYKSFM